MPQWYPAMPRAPFRDRVVKLWAAVAVAAACLVVGFGAGVAVGQATGDDDHGPGRFERFPGGPRDGERFGWGNRPQLPDGSAQRRQPPPGQPAPPPSG